MTAVFKALPDPTRRHVLELLRERPMTAGDLADHFPVSQPTMSAPFAGLRAGALRGRQNAGKAGSYRLMLAVLEDALRGFVGAFSAVTGGAVAGAAKPAGPAPVPAKEPN